MGLFALGQQGGTKSLSLGTHLVQLVLTFSLCIHTEFTCSHDVL